MPDNTDLRERISLISLTVGHLAFDVTRRNSNAYIVQIFNHKRWLVEVVDQITQDQMLWVRKELLTRGLFCLHPQLFLHGISPASDNDDRRLSEPIMCAMHPNFEDQRFFTVERHGNGTHTVRVHAFDHSFIVGHRLRTRLTRDLVSKLVGAGMHEERFPSRYVQLVEIDDAKVVRPTRALQELWRISGPPCPD